MLVRSVQKSVGSYLNVKAGTLGASAFNSDTNPNQAPTLKLGNDQPSQIVTSLLSKPTSPDVPVGSSWFSQSIIPAAMCNPLTGFKIGRGPVRVVTPRGNRLGFEGVGRRVGEGSPAPML